MKQSNNQTISKYLYWSLPLIIFILQAAYTSNSFNQIRYEELEESVVNPYWFQNRVVQNGATSNLGWYFLLVITYKIFGFNLFMGKFIRLGLSLISLFCLAGVLKKYLGTKLAWLPFLTIGLSPTLLYFNTQQTIYGLDISFFLICLFLLTKTDFTKPTRVTFLKQFLFCTLSMVAWLIYPSFIFYLPALFAFYFYKMFKGNFRQKSQFILKNIALSILFFLLPFISGFFYITNRNLLIYDEITRSGILRGAGFFRLDFNLFLTNLKLNLINLFLNHFGYYYEINKVEFSGYYPIISIIFITVITIIIVLKKKILRWPIFLIFSILFLNIILAYFTVDPTPGMRRYTGELVSIYGLFVFVWYFVNNLPKKKAVFKKPAIFLCALLLIHHVIVYPENFLHLKDPSQYRETVWFKTTDNPELILDQYLETIQKQDLKLLCLDSNQNPLNCRYSEVFAAVSAACYWNKLSCHDIYGYDLKTGNYIKLNIKLFNDYYFGLYGREIIAT